MTRNQTAVDMKPSTEAIRSIFLNPRPWYPVEEFAAACGTTQEAMIAGLHPEGYRVFSGGAVEVDHSHLWSLFEAVGHGAIEDALGEDAPQAMLADCMTEPVTIRLPKFAIRWLAKEGGDVAFEAARNLTNDAEDGLGGVEYSATDFPDSDGSILPALDGGQS